MKPTILCIGAPPGTGKSTIVPLMRKKIDSYHFSASPYPWISLDNEWSFSMNMRKLCSDKSGIPLDSPDFVRAFNLQGQLDYQATARNIASQGMNVIMPGPFEDLTPIIGDVTLFWKMRHQDFSEFRFIVIYLLMHPKKRLSPEEIIGHPSMEEIELTIRERLKKRGENNPVQQTLDADKLGEHYYSTRSQKVLRSIAMFPEIGLVTFRPDEDPETIAWRLTKTAVEHVLM